MITAAKVAASEGGKKKKRSKKGGKGTGAGVLSEMVPYLNPELAQEVMAQHSIPPDDILEESAAESLILAAQAAKEMVQGLDRLEEMPGYIFYREIPVNEEEAKTDATGVVKTEEEKKADELF